MSLCAGLASCMGAYNAEWIQRVNLPLEIINRIYSQLNFTAGANDTSDQLYSTLLEYDTYVQFTAVQGFGYAFQDSIGSLQDNVD